MLAPEAGVSADVLDARNQVKGGARQRTAPPSTFESPSHHERGPDTPPYLLGRLGILALGSNAVIILILGI